MVDAIRNPTPEQVRDMIRASGHQAVRRITDPRTGDVYCWPAEQATHAEGAADLLVPYDRPPGAGDILTLDD
ncbi:hypothetical protein [Roseospira navarrensis]|uniref:Uncharacterized protein n=1 Tax=Roseospira navarrensis TaxID=140058 RepID=A0A7X1ZD10_9PROT|nr:hypothetical protein [Roseospira navarrensis]MQX36290.1 hypothetical protein [Roseospira navarrensis]